MKSSPESTGGKQVFQIPTIESALHLADKPNRDPLRGENLLAQ